MTKIISFLVLLYGFAATATPFGSENISDYLGRYRSENCRVEIKAAAENRFDLNVSGRNINIRARNSSIDFLNAWSTSIPLIGTLTAKYVWKVNTRQGMVLITIHQHNDEGMSYLRQYPNIYNNVYPEGNGPANESMTVSFASDRDLQRSVRDGEYESVDEFLEYMEDLATFPASKSCTVEADF